jgi:hypothetical protein
MRVFLIIFLLLLSCNESDKNDKQTKINQITPVNGVKTGNTRVRIFGQGFTENSKVKFGNKEAKIISISDNKIVCLSPKNNSRSTTDPVSVDGTGGGNYGYIENKKVCECKGSEWPCMTTDNANGAFIAFNVPDGNGGYDVFVKRLDQVANQIWLGQKEITSGTNDQRVWKICSDNKGGAIIPWREDKKRATIQVHRILSDGSLAWPNEIPVYESTLEPAYNPRLVRSNDATIFVFEVGAGIRANKITDAGNQAWVANGIQVSGQTEYQICPNACTDGHNGAIATWYGNHTGNYEIYCQKILSNGTLAWTERQITNLPGDQIGAVITEDGNNGAIIAWTDDNIRAQRIDTNGNILWPANGINICDAENRQRQPRIIRLNDFIYIVWWDERIGNRNIYLQKISLTGEIQWQKNGIPICTAPGTQNRVKILSDSGDIFCIWDDGRNGNSDIYAQRIDINGNIKYAENGVAMSTADKEQSSPAAVSNEKDGVIAVWRDFRSESGEIYGGQTVNLDESLSE